MKTPMNDPGCFPRPDLDGSFPRPEDKGDFPRGGPDGTIKIPAPGAPRPDKRKKPLIPPLGR
jgi:hypothetical protein